MTARFVNNYRQLTLLLFLGLVLVPSLGLCSLLAPEKSQDRKNQAGKKLAFIAFFAAAGAVVTAVTVWRCPRGFTFGDSLTVHYLLHKRVFQREDLRVASAEDRSSTLGHGIGQMTANDVKLSLESADGSRVGWAMSRSAADEFGYAFLRWYRAPGEAHSTAGSESGCGETKRDLRS